MQIDNNKPKGASMPKLLPLLLLVICISAQASKHPKTWTAYTSADLFAYSEPVSIKNFARHFDGPLERGDTAFTHDRIEVGVRWQRWQIALVQRFDYVTAFTPDTALVHYDDTHNIPLPNDREYSLMLDVNRINAKGIKVGYTWSPVSTVEVNISGSYYNNISDLQSGRATAQGDLTPITDQLVADAQAVIDNISPTNKDISALYGLVQNVNATIAVNYAYDKPKLHEPEYHQPVIVGAPNPPISGVDFAAPGGTGYAFDLSASWQITRQLQVSLAAMDLINQFSWKGAPQTTGSFDLNPFLVDAIGVGQDFVNGEIVKPNEVIDRHLSVDIFNANYVQRLPHRELLSARYNTGKQLHGFGKSASIVLLGSVYHTRTQNFFSVGLGLNHALHLDWNVSAGALGAGYKGKYFFANLMTDDMKFSDARTLAVSFGVNITL